MSYNDMRAELIITMPDGYRLMPTAFQIPYDRTIEQVLDLERRILEIKRIGYETEIASLKRQLDAALARNAKRRWWRPKRQGSDG